jgi:D-alanine-D-alanine ligase
MDKIGILYSGWSHETSKIVTYPFVVNSLKELGYDYKLFDVTTKDFVSNLKQYNPKAVFLTNQGAYGEDGKLQGLLEYLNIPYTGSGVCASAVGMNKYISKLVFNSLGLRTPNFIYIGSNSQIDYSSIVTKLLSPFIIKPIMAGSSFGIRLISDEESYQIACKEVLSEFGDCLLEEFIDGNQIEYSTGILEDNKQIISLPICKSILKEKIFSSNCKFDNRLNVKLFDFDLDTDLKVELLSIAKRIHIEIGCSGLSRTDMLIDANDKIYVLEYNTIPGLLPSSIFPQICVKQGIIYTEMINMLLKNAFVKKRMEIDKL